MKDPQPEGRTDMAGIILFALVILILVLLGLWLSGAFAGVASR
ncbi:MAG TPA: hypothetical protein VKY74_22295 [Chloroflexia bacterium]|nr:hypothetical protein [Chloroflexia bacterium]